MPRFANLPLLLATAAVLLIAAGCQTEAQKRLAQAEAAGKTTIQFWHAVSGAHQEIIDEFVAEFEEENPDIVVQAIFQGQYNQLKLNINNALAAGSPPATAMMYETWVTQYYEEGQLESLQSLIDEDEEFQAVVEDIYPAFVRNNTIDGQLVSLPFNKSTFIVFYNVERLKKAGYDEFPKTVAQLFEAARKMTERDTAGDVKVFGVGIRSTLEPFTCLFYAHGGQYHQERDGALKIIDMPEAHKALALIDKAVNEDKIAYVDGGYMSGPFGSDVVAMYWGSSAGIPWVEEAVGGKFTMGTAPLPMVAGVEPSYLSQGTNVGIFKGLSEAERQAAWKFLKFLMRPDNAATWAARSGYLPVRRAALEEPELAEYIERTPAYQTCLDQLEYLQFEPKAAYWDQVRSELFQELETAYRDRGTVEDALQAAEERARNIIRRARTR